MEYNSSAEVRRKCSCCKCIPPGRSCVSTITTPVVTSRVRLLPGQKPKLSHSHHVFMSQMTSVEDLSDPWRSMDEATYNNQTVSPELAQALFKTAQVDGSFCGSSIYHVNVLKLLLSTPHTSPKGEDLRSAISKCIERDKPEALALLLPLSLGVTDKRLFLRHVQSVTCYITARHMGWLDVEWEARLGCIQRWWRTKPRVSIRVTFVYTGPEEALYAKCKLYFGYRHSMYKARWDRRNRHRYYQHLVKVNRWGDCAWQAYVDYVENRVDIPHLGTEIPRWSVPRLPLPA